MPTYWASTLCYNSSYDSGYGWHGIYWPGLDSPSGIARKTRPDAAPALIKLAEFATWRACRSSGMQLEG